VISTEDLLWFVDEALDGMIAIVGVLGDDLASRTPQMDGANSAYAVVTHCLGVMEYWGGHIIAGRSVQRDRAAEFRAGGAVNDLLGAMATARGRLRQDLDGLVPSAGPRGKPEPDDARLPLARTQGGALLHVFEELAQHRGQLEITRDLLLAGLRVPAGE
jgi:hypothetical protein